MSINLLVTGGAGFIGSNFIHYWLRRHPDDFVTNFDALTYAGHLENLKDIDNDPHYNFVRGDVTDRETVETVVAEADTIIHFAAESHVDRSIIDPEIFVKTNVLGTNVLLNAALKYKIKRFHHISTDEVFGHLGPDDAPFNENSNYQPRTPYSASKAAADMIVRSFSETYNLPITITNCANNFGPFCDPEKLIPRFITNLIDNKKVPLMGKGENIRPWLYVMDHCRAIELVLERGVIGETYCISGTEQSNIVVTKKILAFFGKNESMIEYVDHRLGHDFRYAMDSAKIKQLGWQPQHSFDEWLARTIEWYQTNEWWWRPLKQGRPILDRVAQKSYGTKFG